MIDLDNTLHENGVLYEDTIRFLYFLKQQGYMVGILSMGDNTIQNMTVDRLGLRKYVDLVWTCNLKDMDMFYKLMKSFKVKSHEVCYIGDNEDYDFYAANNFGIMTMKVRRGPFKDISMGLSNKALIEVDTLQELESVLKTKKVLLVPKRNSIVSTVENILKYYPTIEVYKEDTIKSIKDFDCIIPCSDNHLEFASVVNNANILVSPTKTIRICGDKNSFAEVFDKEKYYPSPVKNRKAVYKDETGSGSKNVTYETFKRQRKGFVVQKFIDGEELTVDCLFSDGELKNMAVRQRNFVWNGLNTLSIFKPEYEDKIRPIIEHMSSKLKFHGPINIQFIKDKKGKFWLTEVNARACSNMCYGGNNNFILNGVLDVIGKNPQYGKVNTKIVDRWMSWDEY